MFSLHKYYCELCDLHKASTSFDCNTGLQISVPNFQHAVSTKWAQNVITKTIRSYFSSGLYIFLFMKGFLLLYILRKCLVFLFFVCFNAHKGVPPLVELHIINVMNVPFLKNKELHIFLYSEFNLIFILLLTLKLSDEVSGFLSV